ncbi:MAG: DUF4082 domain-containing protein [Stigonema ocellatum SAG 48.90 = DSM 106950]|nr:DUF4082 domain-containing protein [Stigonema ocellatum SAG 48.90 = DSM 106950]
MNNQIPESGVLIAQALTTQTLFTNQTPSLPNANDGVPYELGVKFRSAKSGYITAIRHFKSSSETGTHVGKIWSATGNVLATVTFANETASGWQQQALSSPLAIQANTTYVVSVNTNGYFPFTSSGLASSIVNGDLSSVADGNNGVYNTTPSAFPTQSYQNSNYFRDIVFASGNTLIKVSGDNQTGTAGSALPNQLVVQVNNAANNPVSGITVTFAVTSGSASGSVSPSSAVTNSNGQASTVLTLGSASSGASVSATAGSIGSVTFSAKARPANPNAIYLENQNAGTTNWKITNPVTQNAPEIVGYAGATSVNQGGTLPIYVSLAQSGTYSIDVYRLGYYNGTGGRLIFRNGSLNGSPQNPFTVTDSATNLVEVNWSISTTLSVGTNWTSGLYVANLTHGASGKQTQLWFVVRNDSSTSDILFESGFSNFHAYNNSGGYSLYWWNSNGGQRAFKVSSERPFSQTSTRTIEANKILTWEYNMARWLESQSYDVSYVANVDIYSNPQLLKQHKVFLVAGHNEYWSLEERNNVQQARDGKPATNLAFFCANSCYWRTRFEKSNTTGRANSIIACYKDAWAQDPTAATNSAAATNEFRSPENNRAENALLGVMYTADNGDYYGGANFVVTNATDPYYANTNLKNNDTLSQLVGFEWDAVVNNLGSTPSGLVVLSQSPVVPVQGDIDPYLPPDPNNGKIANAVRYTAASGAKVFAVGSFQFMWGLDSDGVSTPREDIRAKQFAVNIFADMGARPQTPDAQIKLP